MRNLNLKNKEINLETLAQVAGQHSTWGLDPRSGIGIGASVLMDYSHSEADYQTAPSRLYEDPDNHRYVYGGMNISLSGMEIKIHAEQLALFQAIIDIEQFKLNEFAEIEKVVVVSSRDTKELCCGHCLQVVRGIGKWLGQDPGKIDYIATEGKSMLGRDGKPEGTNWTYDKYKIDDLLPNTYCEWGEEYFDEDKKRRWQ